MVARSTRASLIAALMAFFAVISSAAHAQQVFEAGEFQIGGRPFPCPGVQTRMFLYLPMLASWTPGFINLDKRFREEEPEVQAFIYAHECAHELFGRSERMADCEGVKLARRLGFVGAGSLDLICKRFQASWAPDNLPGPLRCARIRACFHERD